MSEKRFDLYCFRCPCVMDFPSLAVILVHGTDLRLEHPEYPSEAVQATVTEGTQQSFDLFDPDGVGEISRAEEGETLPESVLRYLLKIHVGAGGPTQIAVDVKVGVQNDVATRMAESPLVFELFLSQ